MFYIKNSVYHEITVSVEDFVKSPLIEAFNAFLVDHQMFLFVKKIIG